MEHGEGPPRVSVLARQGRGEEEDQGSPQGMVWCSPRGHGVALAARAPPRQRGGGCRRPSAGRSGPASRARSPQAAPRPPRPPRACHKA
eukprot:4325111-Prymnesium_polylepis.1